MSKLTWQEALKELDKYVACNKYGNCACDTKECSECPYDYNEAIIPECVEIAVEYIRRKNAKSVEAQKKWRKNNVRGELKKKLNAQNQARSAKQQAASLAGAVNKSKPWSCSEISKVMAKEKPDKELATELGRTLHAVRGMRSKIVTGEREGKEE